MPKLWRNVRQKKDRESGSEMNYKKLNQALTETQEILSKEWEFDSIDETEENRFNLYVRSRHTGVMQVGDYFCPDITYSKQGKDRKVTSIYCLVFSAYFHSRELFSLEFWDDLKMGWMLDKARFDGGSDTFSKFRHTLTIMRDHGVEFSKEVEAMCEKVAVNED